MLIETVNKKDKSIFLPSKNLLDGTFYLRGEAGKH